MVGVCRETLHTNPHIMYRWRWRRRWRWSVCWALPWPARGLVCRRKNVRLPGGRWPRRFSAWRFGSCRVSLLPRSSGPSSGRWPAARWPFVSPSCWDWPWRRCGKCVPTRRPRDTKPSPRTNWHKLSKKFAVGIPTIPHDIMTNYQPPFPPLPCVQGRGEKQEIK